MRDVNSNGDRSGTQSLVRLEIKKEFKSTYIDLEMLAFIYSIFLSQ